jgi:hypothetical protein
LGRKLKDKTKTFCVCPLAHSHAKTIDLDGSHSEAI